MGRCWPPTVLTSAATCVVGCCACSPACASICACAGVSVPVVALLTTFAPWRFINAATSASDTRATPTPACFTYVTPTSFTVLYHHFSFLALVKRLQYRKGKIIQFKQYHFLVVNFKTVVPIELVYHSEI